MKNYRLMLLWIATLIMATKIMAQDTAYAMPDRGLCAHRGGMDTHPENTIPAFRDAIAAGVQMIEFDIQLSKDSVLVVMHDDSVDRTTNGSGRVSDLTLAQIKKLDAGIKKDSRFANTPVPTLEETLALMPRNIWLNCHLKGGASLGKAVALMVQRSGRLHQCLLACSEVAAAGAREAVPGVIICNADNTYRRDNARYTQATIRQKASFIQLVAVGTNQERAPFVKQLRDHAVKVNYFYATAPEEAAGLWNIGVNFILVNNVSSFLPVMKKYGIDTWKNEY